MRFWKNNRLDQEYDIDVERVVGEFLDSQWSRATEENPWPIERRMGAYLLDAKYGTWESKDGDFDRLCIKALDAERQLAGR